MPNKDEENCLFEWPLKKAKQQARSLRKIIPMNLEPKASIQIQKPINEVFEAIVDPNKMTKYFISESNGRLSTGVSLIWKFPEFEEQFPINQVKVENNKAISFVWDPETRVNISLEPHNSESTVIRVTESGKALNEANLHWALENSGGWANFLACLKAYLEYGIELRKGAFDFMRKT